MADRFFVDITSPGLELTTGDIWPDGDAPDDPTPEQVAEVMRKCGRLEQVIRDWELSHYLECYVWAPGTEGVKVW